MSRPKEEEPTISETRTTRDETVYTHPAFGQITLSKIYGGRNLYGSDFHHNSYVEIAIHASQLHRSLSRDWHFARDEYIAVHLSEAQWSSFVSSFNVGGGTPCTIDYVRGEGHKPYLPDRPITPIFKNEVDKKLAATIGHVKDTIKVIKENTANLSKAKQANILVSLETTLRELESNLPFVSEQFGEHMETVVEKAKSEVNAYAMNTIVRLGLDVLKDHKTPEIELHTKKDE